LSYKEINIEEANISRDELTKLTGSYTVPQIIINDEVIGGFEELLILNQKGRLN
tara:strand:+ start:464 stop:625 length:162 start_codon:yes stop_codon:yes gene_type:complete